MSDGNGTGFIEKDTLEVRAGTLEIRCAGMARRSGDSDRLEIGDTTARDVVAGEESLHVRGRFTERIGGSVNTRASHLKTTVNGRLKVSGRAETTLLGGAMADTQAGAVLVAAGMSDDLVIGGGARATAPADIWLAGLIGMEEKVGTAAADGVLMECYRTLFEREYGSGTHVTGAAVFSGTLHVTVKAGFRPMMKVLRGIRNLTPGGGGGSTPPSATPPAAPPPPVPPGEAATGLIGTFRGVSDAEDAGDLPRLSERLAHAEDLANATGTPGAREADTASRLEDLQSLRYTAESGDTQVSAVIQLRPHGDDAVASQRPTYVDFNARYYLSMDADGRYMLVEDPEGPYQLAQGPDGSCRVVQDPEAEFTASKDLRGYDIEVGPDGRFRLVDPDASESDPAHWRHSVGSRESPDDPGRSRIAGDAPRRLDDPADPVHARPFGDDGARDSRAGNPPGTPSSDRLADPGHARTLDLRPEPAPPDGPGAGDSRAGPIATIETVGQRSWAVPPEGGDLTRRPIGSSSGAGEASRGQVHATVIRDPAMNQGVTTPLATPAADDSSRFLLDIEIEQIDLEHVDDARDLPSPGRLSDSAGEGPGPGMQLGDRGPRWEEPDLAPAGSDAPRDTPGRNDSPTADIPHGLPEDSPGQPSEPPAVSRFYGGDDAVATPPPASTPSGPDAGPRLPANVDTTGAIQRLEQEIALQTEEIRRVRDGGGSADDLRHLEAEREARGLALSELQAGRDPRPALRTQAAEAQEAYRTEALTDLVDYFGGSGHQFSPQGTSPGTAGLRGRIPSSLDTSALLADWRAHVSALSEAADAMNPRTPAEIEHAEALSDTEAWMRQAIVMTTQRQDPSSELLRHAADLEARTFADGTTGAGEASMLRAMAKQYQDLLEELLGSFPAVPKLPDEVDTLPGSSPRRLDFDAEIGTSGRDVPVESTDMRGTGDAGAGAVESGDRAATIDNARRNLGDDIYDAFGAFSPRRDTPIADPGSDQGRHLTREDYWGTRRGLSPPDPGSSGDAADTATDPVRVPDRGERGASASDPRHVLDGMEAAFDDTARAPPSSSPPPDSGRYRIATGRLDDAPPSARRGYSELMGMRYDLAGRDELARYLSGTGGLDEMADPEAWRAYHRWYPAEAEELWESTWYSKRQGNIERGRHPDRGVPAAPWTGGEQGP